MLHAATMWMWVDEDGNGGGGGGSTQLTYHDHKKNMLRVWTAFVCTLSFLSSLSIDATEYMTPNRSMPAATISNRIGNSTRYL